MVELFRQVGVLLPEPSVFILQADEEKVPLPDIVEVLERDIDRVFDGGCRLQDHFPQELCFGQPDRAEGEDG